jgi:hypothetical protein
LDGKKFNYLINNPVVQHCEVIAGRFYRQGFGISMDKIIAFELYMRANQRNDTIGHNTRNKRLAVMDTVGYGSRLCKVEVGEK